MRGAAVVLLVLLLLPTPSSASVVEAEFSAGSASFDGMRFDGPAMFFGAVGPGLGPARYSFQAAAADVEVQWQEYEDAAGVHTAPPSLPGRPAEGTEGPQRHENVTATTTRVGMRAFLQAEGPDGPGGRETFAVDAAVATLEPRQELSFQRTTDTGSKWQPSRHGPWPNLEGRAAGTEPVVLRGDFVLTVFDADLSMRADDGATTYETGIVEQERIPPGNETVAARGEYRRALVTLHDATLTYWPAGQEYQFHARGGRLHGDGVARFDDAVGTVGTTGAKVDGARLELDARLDGTVSHRPGAVAATLALTDVRHVRLDGAELAVAAPTPPLARSLGRVSGSALLLAAIVGGLGWRVHTRRLGPDTLVLAADWALDSGRPRRAARWARRALRHDHADSDAAVIQAVALFRTGRHERGVRWLRAWMEEHGDPDGELSLALGLGLLQTGDAADAAAGERQVRRALEANPELLAHPAGSGRGGHRA